MAENATAAEADPTGFGKPMGSLVYHTWPVCGRRLLDDGSRALIISHELLTRYKCLPQEFLPFPHVSFLGNPGGKN